MILNVPTALPEAAPCEHSIVTVATPGSVLDPTFQVHETLPVDGTVRAGLRPLALEIVPDGSVTDAVQTDPATVTAVTVAFEPCLTEADRLVILTERAAGKAVGPALELGPALGPPAEAEGPAEFVAVVKAIP